MKKFFFPLRVTPAGFVTFFLLGTCGKAHAGYWEADHYEWSGEANQKTASSLQSEDGYVTQIQTVQDHEDVGPPPPHDASEIFQEGDLWTTGLTRYSNYYGSMSNAQVVLGVASVNTAANSKVHVVMKWHRNTKQDPDNDEVQISDPTDNPPPYLYIYEKAAIYATKSAFQSGGTISAYDGPLQTTPRWPGAYFEFQGALKSSKASDSGWSIQLSNDDWAYNRWYDAIGAAYSQTKRDEMNIVRKLQVKGDVVDGPEMSFSGTVKMKPGYEHDGSSGNASVSCEYLVQPVSFQLNGRRKGDEAATNLSSRFDSNSDSIIAAGGKSSNEHKMEVRLRVTVPGPWGSTQGVPDVPLAILPELRLKKRLGVDNNRATASNNVEGAAPTTDANGYVMRGVVTSRNLVDLTDSVTSAELDETNGFPSLPVHQTWASVEWKLGENGDGDWDNQFELGDEDYSDWIWTKLTTVDARPLTNHSLKFLVKNLKVKIADQDTGESKIKFFTINSAEAAQERINFPDEDVVCQEDLAGLVSSYITPSISGNSDSSGIFKGQFTVKHSDNFVVDTFDYYIQDQDVYQD